MADRAAEGIGRMGDLPKLSTLRSFPIKGTNGEVEYVDICERITDCNKFGDILLESECGSVVTAINQQCRGDACNTNRSILDKWLKGNGKKKVTYERLIEVIKRCGYGILADQMKDSFSGLNTCVMEDQPQQMSADTSEPALCPPRKKAKLDHVSKLKFKDWKWLYNQYKGKNAAIVEKVESYQEDVQRETDNILLGIGRFVAERFRFKKGSGLNLSSIQLKAAKRVLMADKLVTPELCATIVIVSRDVKAVHSVLSTLIEEIGEKSAVELFYCLATLFLAFSNSHHNLSPRFHFYVYHSIRSWEEESQKRDDSELTEEQRRVVTYKFKGKELLKVEACAGSGKTHTLVKFAANNRNLRILYCCFNRSMKEQAVSLFPKKVDVMNHHSLAFEILQMKSEDVCENFTTYYVKEWLNKSGHYSESSPHTFADSVHKTLEAFMVSADHKIMKTHLSKDCGDHDTVLKASKDMWKQMQDRSNKSVRIPHDGYTKQLQLEGTILQCYDCILIDEAEDLTPAQLAIYMSQNHCVKIFSGDSNQGIYGFRGAINDLSKVEASNTLQLSQSFRFGPEIAYKAFFPLQDLSCKHVMIGNMRRATVSGCGQTAFIARKNITLFEKMIEMSKKAHHSAKFGFPGGDELSDILDIYWLKKESEDKISKSSGLAKFQDYDDFEEYVKESHDNRYEWKLRVCKYYETKLPDLVTRIQDRIEKDCKKAKYVFATVYKAKGLEFDTVHLLDFSTQELEKALKHDDSHFMKRLYVAITRAKHNVIMSSGLQKLMTRRNEPFTYITNKVKKGECCVCKKSNQLYFERDKIELSDCPETLVSVGGVCTACLEEQLSYREHMF